MTSRDLVGCRAAGGALGVLVSILLACGGKQVPVYQTPPQNAPHAALEIRVIYQSWDGPNLRQTAHLNDEQVGLNLAQGQVSSTPFLMHPGRAWLGLSLDFYEVTETSNKHYDSKGNYSHSTTGITNYRNTASCQVGTWVPGVQHESYLVQVTYVGPQSCSVVCKRRVPDGAGGEQLLPCEG